MELFASDGSLEDSQIALAVTDAPDFQIVRSEGYIRSCVHASVLVWLAEQAVEPRVVRRRKVRRVRTDCQDKKRQR